MAFGKSSEKLLENINLLKTYFGVVTADTCYMYYFEIWLLSTLILIICLEA